MNLENSRYAQVLLARARSKETEMEEFTRAVHQLGLMLAPRVLEGMPRRSVSIETPLQEMVCEEVHGRVALVPVLRAGKGILPAFQAFVPNAYVWNLGLARDEETLACREYRNDVPQQMPNDVSMIVVLEVMLATGGSLAHTLKLLEDAGASNVHVACVLAAPEGVQRIREEFSSVALHYVKVDRRLTGENDPWPNGFILPGLGDAGDRLYGPK